MQWGIRAMDYFDFDLLLERSDNAYLARVVSSPAGQAEGWAAAQGGAEGELT